MAFLDTIKSGLSSVGQGLFGSPGQQMQFQRFTPQQQQLQNQSIQQLMGLLQNNMSGQQGFDFAPIAQRARTNFQTQTVPMLAERFASLGSNRRSSGLEGTLGAAGAGLEEGLAGLESKYNLASQGQQGQQRQQLLSLLLSLASQPAFESAYRPATPGLLGGLAGGLGQAAGSFASLPLYQYLGLL
jgi:hypothetical protein